MNTTLVTLIVLNTVLGVPVDIDIYNMKDYQSYSRRSPAITVYYIKGHRLSQQLIRKIPDIEKAIPHIPIFTIACTNKNKVLCKAPGITNMPFVQITKFGISKDINGQLSVDQIIAFIRNADKVKIGFIGKEKDIRDAKRMIYLDNGIIVVKGEIDRKTKNQLQKLAFKYQESLRFYKLSELAVKEFKLNEKPDGVYLKRYRSNEPIFYNKKSKASLSQFIMNKHFVEVATLTKNIWEEKKQKTDQIFMILFNMNCKRDHLYKINEAGSFNSYDNIKFFKLKKGNDTEFYTQLQLQFGVPDKCTLIAVKQETEGKESLYLFNDKIDSQNIGMFINKVEHDKHEKYRKVKSISLLNENEVNRLQLENLLFTLNKGLFVLYIRNEDVTSSIYNEFKAVVSIDDVYDIKYLNVDQNDVQEPSNYTLPVILYYGSDTKNKPVTYDGPLTSYALERFTKSRSVVIKEAESE